MFMNFLRNNVYASGILTVLRIYLGWKWLTAGWGKITGEPFNAAGYLNGSVNNPVMSGESLVYPNYVAFLENVAIPNADLFSFMVAWGEFLVGLGLILGVLTTAAAFFGVVMNFSFMFAGTVSTNPWMILISMFILAAGANAGKFGGDRWVLPYLKQLVFGKLIKKTNNVETTA
ncbi:Crp/Fnr family transcriptional regulator [Anaerobacillus alkalidiazotrophicus]|uniref:Crp/Fnr family transcriptional regulator n=1 Tax=Anaerobacillus alkalidiazotrophicus TaxID=472963 RepID=A0A1S2MCR1_9BACI|nr:DoxX family protein [Anaerobacillus alkalidiazotrophicus]OIJ21455.1 Crp/Fnr family transcriptional regulator [Anaerobacillus alkalidiazotrophicus]